MEPTFKEGDRVFAKAEPATALVVRRYVDMIYYCRIENDPAANERVYFERELEGVKPSSENKT